MSPVAPVPTEQAPNESPRACGCSSTPNTCGCLDQYLIPERRSGKSVARENVITVVGKPKTGKVNSVDLVQALDQHITEVVMNIRDNVRVINKSNLGGRIDPDCGVHTGVTIYIDLASTPDETALAVLEMLKQDMLQGPKSDIVKMEDDILAAEPIHELTHENSLSVGAVRTGHGPDVLKPTVRDTPDTAAVPFPLAGVGGLQDGAAVPPIAAASPPGGDAVSSPKQAASLPPSSEREVTAVTVHVLGAPIPSTGDREVSTVEVRIPRKSGWFAGSRSTPYVTTQFWFLAAVSVASSWVLLVTLMIYFTIRGPK